MKRIFALTVAALLSYQPAHVAAQVGVMPVPQIDTAQVETTVDIVRGVGSTPTEYIYRYSVTNPSTSSNGYYKFSLDVSAERNSNFKPTLQTLPMQGGNATRSFDDEFAVYAPFFGIEGPGIVPIGLECPPGWTGGLRRDASVVCYAANGTPLIEPGETLAGFAIHSRLPPMVRELDNTAFWTVVVETLEDDVDTEAAYQVLEDLRRPQMTLGPSYAFPRDRQHYVLFLRDFVEIKSAGWIPNQVLADDLTDILEDAGQLFRTGQGTQAKLRLDDVIGALDVAGATDVLPDADTFLRVNVDSIQEFGSNTFLSGGLDTQLRFSPAAAQREIGSEFELETFAFRLNNSDFRNGTVEVPSTSTTVYFGCDTSASVEPGADPCPNVPLGQSPFPGNLNPVPVDSEGIARFSYVGSRVGRDHIQLCIDSFCEGVLGRVTVDWSSPVDLVIQAFSPPLIKAQSGDLITFTDRTLNRGSGVSAASATAFYLSEDEVVDPATAFFVGSRGVPSLQPGEVSQEMNTEFALPPGIGPGFHNLIACADNDQEVEESNELNNCSNVKVAGIEFFAAPVADFEDLFVVSIIDTSVAEGDSGTTTAVIDVELSQRNPDSPITFGFEVDDGTATANDNDYVRSSGTVEFAAGTGPATQQIIATIVGDTMPEDDETVSVKINPIGGDAIYRTQQATVTILDDDSGGSNCLIRLDELVERDGSGQLAYAGSDQGKAGTGLRLTSMGRILDINSHPVFSVWRIRNTAMSAQQVLLDAYNDPYEAVLSVEARTELFFASPVATGAATHRLFLGTVQVDVKAAGNQQFIDATEVNDPACVP